MCCALFGGGEEAAGTMTSGGTESIIMAVKTHRDYGVYCILTINVNIQLSIGRSVTPDHPRSSVEYTLLYKRQYFWYV